VFPIYSSPSERASHVSLTSYPHAETVYWVIPVVDNAFSVEVVSPEYHPTTVGPFATASDAKAWIAEQRQRGTVRRDPSPSRRLNELGIAHRYEEFPDNRYRGRLSDGRKFAFSEPVTSQRRNTEVCLTHRWRKADSNPRSLSRGSYLILA
jgi:hypothetical protein